MHSLHFQATRESAEDFSQETAIMLKAMLLPRVVVANPAGYGVFILEPDERVEKHDRAAAIGGRDSGFSRNLDVHPKPVGVWVVKVWMFRGLRRDQN
jgi:hypothetical protein